MSKFSAADVESTARRAGWAITTERAEQIAATAAPRIEAFGRIKSRLTFEDDAAAFAAALVETMLKVEAK
jgi:hypothetical protein